MATMVLFGCLQLLWAVDDSALFSFICALFHVLCLALLFIVVRPAGTFGVYYVNECNTLAEWTTRTYLIFMLILLCEEIILVVLATRKTIMDRLQVCATPVSVVLHFIVVQRVAFSVFLVWTSFALHIFALFDDPDLSSEYADSSTGSAELQQVYSNGNFTTTNSSSVVDCANTFRDWRFNLMMVIAWLECITAAVYLIFSIDACASTKCVKVIQRSLKCCCQLISHDASVTDLIFEELMFLNKAWRSCDVTPSDIAAAALVLAQKKHNLWDEITEGENTHPKGENIHPGGENSHPGGENAHPGVNEGDTDWPSRDQIVLDAAHYVKYAVGCYGWLVFAAANCCECRCASITPGDDLEVLYTITGLTEEQMLYHSFRDDRLRKPWFMAREVGRRTVVIGIRGTLSLLDIMTDLNFASFNNVEQHGSGQPLGDWGERFGFPGDGEFAHFEMWKSASSIHEKILELVDTTIAPLLDTSGEDSDIEQQTPLEVVVTGHSLGAGIAALLTLMLRGTPAFKRCRVRCVAFSPPGGLLTSGIARWMSSFCTSVVLGHDLVPRLSLFNVNRFRDDLTEAGVYSAETKLSLFLKSFLNILLQFCGCHTRQRHACMPKTHIILPEGCRLTLEQYRNSCEKFNQERSAADLELTHGVLPHDTVSDGNIDRGGGGDGVGGELTDAGITTALNTFAETGDKSYGSCDPVQEQQSDTVDKAESSAISFMDTNKKIGMQNPQAPRPPQAMKMRIGRLTRHECIVPLWPPGRLMYIVTRYTKESCWCTAKDKEYKAEEVAPQKYLSRFVVSPRMMRDHLPWNVQQAIDKVAAEIGDVSHAKTL